MADAATTDGLKPTPWAGLRQVADRIVEIADALDDEGISAGSWCQGVAGNGSNRIARELELLDRQLCEDSTGIAPFTNLVQQVMTTEPYKSANRVFWIVDNGSSHRGQAAIDRLAAQFPNTVMVHTPVHASWLNQVVRHESRTQAVTLVEGGRLMPQT